MTEKFHPNWDIGKHCIPRSEGDRRTLHKKWSFPLGISSVNVNKSAVFRGYGKRLVAWNWL